MRLQSRNLGLFVPGAWSVPQTPVALSGVGEFVPGSFAVPQNPVIPGLSGVRGMGCGGDCGCGCGGKCGMGALDTSSVSGFFKSLVSGVESGDMTSLAIVGGTVLGLWFFMSGRHRR